MLTWYNMACTLWAWMEHKCHNDNQLCTGSLYKEKKGNITAISQQTLAPPDIWHPPDPDIALQTQIIRVEEDKEKMESEMMRQSRDLEMLQNTIQKSQRERENMQSEMEVLLDRINKMSDMLDKARVGCL